MGGKPLWIEVLAPGTYRLADGRRVTYTRADTENAARQGNAMIRAGLSVPLCWEHDPRAGPAYLSDLHKNAWLARGYFGNASEFRTTRSGKLYARPRIADPADGRQFRKVGRVSPRLDFDFTDETGRTWPGLTVAHIAVTPRPVQRHQPKPSEMFPSELSLTAAPGTARDSHYLSYATRLGDDTMADETDDTPGSETGDKTGSGLADLIAALRDHGLNIPDEATDIPGLIIAVKACKPGDYDPDGDGDGGEGEAPAAAGDDTQPAGGMPPALMSYMDQAAGVAKGEIQHRIDRLFRTGRIDGALQRKLGGELKAANLSHESFEKNGTLKPLPVLAKIEAYEELPAGKFAKKPGRADLSHTAEVDAPEQLKGGDEPDAAVLAEQERLASFYSVSKK